MAILMVMLLHSTRPTGGGALDRFVAFWVSAMPTGVDLFFVLSGFLITGILYDSKEMKGYFRNFYARRFLRIFPLYYAFLLIFLILLPRITYFDDRLTPTSAPANQIWYWAYLSNVPIALRGWQHLFADVSWSLAIEEQFYLLWPFVVLRLGRRQLMVVCGLIVGVAVLFRAGFTLARISDTVGLLTLCKADRLAVGAFIALALRGKSGIGQLARWARPLSLASGSLLLTIALRHGTFDPNDLSMPILGGTLFAVFYGAILVFALGSSPHAAIARALQLPALRMLGRYSYALYLIHVPAQRLIESRLTWLGRRPPVPGSSIPGTVVFPGMFDQVLFHVACIALSLFVAWLSWHLYEKRFLELKGFFAYATPVPVAIEAGADSDPRFASLAARTAFASGAGVLSASLRSAHRISFRGGSTAGKDRSRSDGNHEVGDG